MNNLVSRNPVQRFKKGRKIVKAQNSWGEGFGLKNVGNIFGPRVSVGYEIPNSDNDFSLGTFARYTGYNPPRTNGNMLYDFPESQPSSTAAEKPAAKEPVTEKPAAKEPAAAEISSTKEYKKPLNKNRFISIYDKNGTWAANAKANNLTSRAQVREFQKNVLNMGDASDGIWGKNTEKAYQEYLKSNNKIKYTPGIKTNQTFTPTGETTTDFNIAKEYLIPKQKTTTFNLGNYTGDLTRTYNAGNIRANRGNLYSNVDEYWNYLNDNKNSDDFQLFQNIMGTQDEGLNREAFNAVMSKYGISGNLGRRDSGRLAKLLNDLRAIGIEGSEARNAFLNSYRQSFDNVQTNRFKQGGLISRNPIKRFKQKNFRKVAQ